MVAVMSLFIKHIIIPGTAATAIALLYMIPNSPIDDVNRDWMAIAVAFISLFAGLVTGVLGVLASSKGDPAAGWWIASTCILVMPALLVIGVLGTSISKGIGGG